MKETRRRLDLGVVAEVHREEKEPVASTSGGGEGRYMAIYSLL